LATASFEASTICCADVVSDVRLTAEAAKEPPNSKLRANAPVSNSFLILFYFIFKVKNNWLLAFWLIYPNFFMVGQHLCLFNRDTDVFAGYDFANV
jgi:hypothetical protein